MKILVQTDEQLVLRDRPILYWCAAVPILAIVLASWYSVIFGTNVATKLKCDRSLQNQVNCTLERFNAVTPTETLKISAPQSAKIVTEEFSLKGTIKYNSQVVILTSSEKYFLLPPVESGDEEPKNQQVADLINQFINSKKNTLELQQDRWGEVIVPLFLTFIFTLMMTPVTFYIVTLPSICCTFDKKLNRVKIERQSLLNRKIWDEPLTNISEIRIQPYFKSFFQKSRLALVFKSQPEAILHNNFISNQKVNNLSENIKSFLDAGVG